MANKRVTDLTAITTAPVSGVIHFIDTTDTSQNAAGSSFKVTKADLLKENTAAILLNTAKIGITPTQATAITTNTAKVGYTDELVAAAPSVVANTAKVGITTTQATAIIANSSKVGYTDALVAAAPTVIANTAKVGITTTQASAITANTAKVGYTDALVLASPAILSSNINILDLDKKTVGNILKLTTYSTGARNIDLLVPSLIGESIIVKLTGITANTTLYGYTEIGGNAGVGIQNIIAFGITANFESTITLGYNLKSLRLVNTTSSATLEIVSNTSINKRLATTESNLVTNNAQLTKNTNEINDLNVERKGIVFDNTYNTITGRNIDLATIINKGTPINILTLGVTLNFIFILYSEIGGSSGTGLSFFVANGSNSNINTDLTTPFDVKSVRIFNGNIGTQVIINDYTKSTSKRLSSLELSKTKESLRLAKIKSGYNFDYQKGFMPERYITSYVNGLVMRNNMSNGLTYLKDTGDKLAHVPNMVIKNGFVYTVYISSKTHFLEGAGYNNSITLAVFSLANPTAVTYYRVAQFDTTYGSYSISGSVTEPLIIDSNNGLLQLFFVAKLTGDTSNNGYTTFTRNYTISNSTFGSVSACNFVNKGVSTTFKTSNINTSLAYLFTKYGLTGYKGAMALTSNVTVRNEGGTDFYYAGVGSGEVAPYVRGMIIKTSNFIDWNFVAMPDFDVQNDYELNPYVIGDIAYVAIRTNTDADGINNLVVCKYNILTDTWFDNMYIRDARSRPFWMRDGINLHLIHQPIDRNHISIIKINTTFLEKSEEIQVVDSLGIQDSNIPYDNGFTAINEVMYPIIIFENSKYYMVYTIDRYCIGFSEINIGLKTRFETRTVFKNLFSV